MPANEIRLRCPCGYVLLEATCPEGVALQAFRQAWKDDANPLHCGMCGSSYRAVCDGVPASQMGGLTLADISAPAALSVTPLTGPSAGGTKCTLLGRSFKTAAPTVRVGGKQAWEITVLDDTHLTFLTPVASPGRADVEVSSVHGSRLEKLFVKNQSGSLEGELLTGSSAGVTARVIQQGDGWVIVDNATHSFVVGEKLTGWFTLATAVYTGRDGSKLPLVFNYT